LHQADCNSNGASHPLRPDFTVSCYVHGDKSNDFSLKSISAQCNSSRGLNPSMARYTIKLLRSMETSCRSKLLPQITLSSHCNIRCLDSRAYLTCPSYPYCYRSGRLGLPHPTALHTRCRCWRGWDLVRDPSFEPITQYM